MKGARSGVVAKRFGECHFQCVLQIELNLWPSNGPTPVDTWDSSRLTPYRQRFASADQDGLGLTQTHG